MPKQAVEPNTALDAISADLDAMAGEIATCAGQVAKLGEDQRETLSEVRAVDHKLDTLLDLIRTRILPAADEIDSLRARIVRCEDGAARQLDGQ